jgi:hypothetical protein
LRPTSFAIDFIEGETFDGYTRDEDWNGFACPYFSLEQGRRVVDAWQRKGWKARYDVEADSFIFEMQAGGGEPDYETYAGSEVEGVKVYPIGAFSWIWDEVGVAESPAETTRA